MPKPGDPYPREMKMLVNDTARELQDSHAELTWTGDRYAVRIDGKTLTALVAKGSRSTWVSIAGRVFEIRPESFSPSAAGPESGELRSIMPGAVAAVLVVEGDIVEQGQSLVVLEAMKTQQPYVSPFAGRVATVAVKAGEQVMDGQLLVRIAP